MKDDGVQWVSPVEAARRLGVSERTVYRRMKAGRYPTRKTDEDRWLVGIPPTDTVSDAARQMSQAATASAVTTAKTSDALSDVVRLAQTATRDARSWRRAAVTLFVVLLGLGGGLGWVTLDLTRKSTLWEARHETARAEVDRLDRERGEALRTSENASSEVVRLKAEKGALEARLEAADRTLGILGLTAETVANAGEVAP